MIRNENGQLVGYVSIDVAGRDIGSYVEEAQKLVAGGLRLPTGYSLQWSGQFENMVRVKERLKMVIPLTLALIWALIYLNTRSAAKTAIILLAVPFSLIGAVWLLWASHYNLSVAVAVGMIALANLDAETGIFMLLYLDLAHDRAKAEGRLQDVPQLKAAIVHGAVKRVRPKVMTVACAFVGLLPIMFSSGEGADVMKRIAAPMVGRPLLFLRTGANRLSGSLLSLEEKGVKAMIKKLFAIALISLLLAGSQAAWAAKKIRPKVKAKAVALSITEEGFVPETLKLKKGVAYELVVTRTTGRTCAKQIAIPGCPVTDLPLNVPVKIAFISKTARDVDYSCGMGMLHGVLSVE